MTWRNHSSHWGAFLARSSGGALEVRRHPRDTGAAPLIGNGAGSPSARVQRPAIRRGWLEHGPGASSERGIDPFVEVEWSELIELLGTELRRVYDTYGAEAVFGGSYGWASAGRFHHAPSQLHRFLNLLGGYVRSVNTYSIGASAVIVPHVLGVDVSELVQRATTWENIAHNTNVLLAFGGIATKNSAVAPGGATDHATADWLEVMRDRGVTCHLFSPLRDDLSVAHRWWDLRPATDTAVMLGLIHTIVTAELHDIEFLEHFCVGWQRLERYILGIDDGVPKSAEWAAEISGLDAHELRELALTLPGRRVLVQTSWSLQRAEHGEQSVWAGVALAAVLGQIGLPGGGFGHGYGSMTSIGTPEVLTGIPSFPQGSNPVRAHIPVARAADMLRKPGGEYHYNGKVCTYPDIRLVYWCGGNPFHHHQHLTALREAWSRPDTIVVHEPWWTAAAKHADIVIPSTITLERNDIGANVNDPWLQAMHQVLSPIGDARNDFDVFAALTEHVLGDSALFTLGRDEAGWIQYLYAELAQRCERHDRTLPSFDEWWSVGFTELPTRSRDTVLLSEFRDDPQLHPVRTPSGRIELFSDTIAAFDYADCPPHATWIEPREWLGAPGASEWPLHLIANQPTGRLHSQLDMGAVSMSMKTSGRETLRMNPADANDRDLVDGDIVLVHNSRGSCLAGVKISHDVRVGVVILPTGAWFDPRDPQSGDFMCVHGNPNVLTADQGTSALAQGCTGQHALVEVSRWVGEAPPVRAHQPPIFVTR